MELTAKLILALYIGLVCAMSIIGGRMSHDREFALQQSFENALHAKLRRQTTTYSVRPTIAVYNRMLTTEEIKTEATW